MSLEVTPIRIEAGSRERSGYFSARNSTHLSVFNWLRSGSMSLGSSEIAGSTFRSIPSFDL